MSFSSLIYVGICWGMFRLGAFSERNPGEVTRRVKLAWGWLREWLKEST